MDVKNQIIVPILLDISLSSFNVPGDQEVLNAPEYFNSAPFKNIYV